MRLGDDPASEHQKSFPRLSEYTAKRFQVAILCLSLNSLPEQHLSRLHGTAGEVYISRRKG